MKNVLAIFIFWRIYITIALVAGLALPTVTNYLGGGVDNYFSSPLVWAWANFDGVHNLSIATGRYGQYEQAFFPLYPLLINLFSDVLHLNHVLVGILISQISIVLGLFVLQKLLRLDLNHKETVWAGLLLMFFPASFYYGSVYSEALFFLLSVGCFYAARKKIWWLAGILGMLASGTRVVGIFLFPAILIEYFLCHCEELRSVYMNVATWESSPVKKIAALASLARNDRGWLWLFLIPTGLILYMIWLNNTYGDSLYFLHAHAAFGANRSVERIVLLPQVFFRYLKIFATASFSYQYLIAIYEFATASFFLVLTIYAFKALRFSYALYAFCLYIVPTISGTFLSMPRLVMVIFPLFMVLIKIVKSETYLKLLLIAFIVLLFISTMLFTRGYWIA